MKSETEVATTPANAGEPASEGSQAAPEDTPEAAPKTAPEAAPEMAPEGAAPAADVSTWATGSVIPSGMNGVPGIEILELRKNGSGPVCGTGKQATVQYKAMLADGTVKDPGPRYTFKVGAGRVIKGWDLAVQKMRVGDSFIVKIPEGLAYPGQGDWKFEMELISFN